MLSANFKPKSTAAASRRFLATARLSCYFSMCRPTNCHISYVSAEAIPDPKQAMSLPLRLKSINLYST